MKYHTKKVTRTFELMGEVITKTYDVPATPEEELYYLYEPPEETYKKQIEDLVTKMFIQDHNAKSGRLRYQFDLWEMLTVNEVTSSMKADILKCMVELKSRKPFSDYGNYSDLKERVEAFEPKKVQRDPSVTGFSVSDWAVAFFFIDINTKTSGTVKERMERFIKEHGIETKPGYFKKEYYDVKKRIKWTEDKSYPPLPPERVKNILPLLENDKKAQVAATEDINTLFDYLDQYEDKKNEVVTRSRYR